MRRWICYLPAVGWMVLIFLGSTELGSPEHSSRILVPLLKWLKPDLSPEAIHTIQAFARKMAHMTEYGTLAMLIWIGRRWSRQNFKLWNWKEAGAIVTVCALYATSDEIHQYFVQSRTASPIDVCIDTTGAFLTLIAFWFLRGLLNRRRQRSKERSTEPSVEFGRTVE